MIMVNKDKNKSVVVFCKIENNVELIGEETLIHVLLLFVIYRCVVCCCGLCVQVWSVVHMYTHTHTHTHRVLFYYW
jgi:hypothetical protein